MQSSILLILLSLSVFCATAQEWELQRDEDSVEVFSRATDTGYTEIKAVTKLKSRPGALMALLDDTEAAPAWIAYCREVETLSWFGADQRTVHTYFSAPWPLSDRDMVIFSKATVDPEDQSVTIDIIDKGAEHLVQSHYVRMKNVRGQWRVTPLPDGMVEIRYQGYGEAAGALPAWVANNLSVSSVHETFVNLRKFIQLDKYQQTEGR